MFCVSLNEMARRLRGKRLRRWRKKLEIEVKIYKGKLTKKKDDKQERLGSSNNADGSYESE